MAMKGITHRMMKVNGINVHVAEKGEGPVVLFIHGFPELWYTWRHQINALAARGYRAVAPDLRGYGDTDAPPSPADYSIFSLVGDLIALIDALTHDEENPSGESSPQQVFVVGHDWGASLAWHLCLFRPDRVKALVNLSIVFSPRNPNSKPLDSLRSVYGDDYYIVRFQEPEVAEKLFAKAGPGSLLRRLFSDRSPSPLLFSELESSLGGEISLPSWQSEEDLLYFAGKFEKTGFTGGLNYYRSIDRNWELMAPWTGAKVEVPTKFIVGDLDPAYHGPGTQSFIHNGGLKKFVPLLEEVVVMEGVGHFINEEKPDEINDHIVDFFNRF